MAKRREQAAGAQAGAPPAPADPAVLAAQTAQAQAKALTAEAKALAAMAHHDSGAGVGFEGVVAPAVAPTVAPAVAPAVAPMTLGQKIERIKAELGLEMTLPLPRAVADANVMLGIEPTGPLGEQVNRLLAELALV